LRLYRCLGRSFAVTNIKVLLSVLLRKFSFELLDGPDTKIVEAITFVHRPKEEVVDGVKSAEPIVRMRVRAVE
jgi:cytochrome P450